MAESDWTAHMRSLLGKEVAVTIDRGDREDGTKGEPAVVKGTLHAFTEDGEVTVRDDCGILHWAWPNLETVAISDAPRGPGFSADSRPFPANVRLDAYAVAE